jgi:hypothetical protein
LARWPLAVARVIAGAADVSATGRAAVKLPCGHEVRGLYDVQMRFDFDDADLVTLTFVGKRPSEAEMDRATREGLSQAVKDEGSRDIRVSDRLRLREDFDPRDDQRLQPYGPARRLVYSASKRMISVRTVAPLRISVNR